MAEADGWGNNSRSASAHEASPFLGQGLYKGAVCVCYICIKCRSGVCARVYCTRELYTVVIFAFVVMFLSSAYHDHHHNLYHSGNSLLLILLSRLLFYLVICGGY